MTSLVSRDAPRQQGHLLPTPGSCSSIDLNSVLLGSGSLDNLLSYPLLLPSCTSGSLSLRDVPPFPAHAVPPLFLNAFEDLPRKRPVDPKWTSNAVITIPTSPRLRNTMMEAICIDWWRVRITCSLCFLSLISRGGSRTYLAAPLPPISGLMSLGYSARSHGSQRVPWYSPNASGAYATSVRRAMSVVCPIYSSAYKAGTPSSSTRILARKLGSWLGMSVL